MWWPGWQSWSEKVPRGDFLWEPESTVEIHSQDQLSPRGNTRDRVYCELTWAWSSFLMKWICLWDVTALLLFPSSLVPPVFPPAYAEPGCVAVYTGSLNRKAHMVVLLSITSQAVHLPWCWPTALILYESSSTCITSEITRSFLFFLGALDQTLGVGHHPRPILPGWGTPAMSWCFNKPMA